MEIHEIREKKRKLEQDILALIRNFEDEITILVKKITPAHATTPILQQTLKGRGVVRMTLVSRIILGDKVGNGAKCSFKAAEMDCYAAPVSRTKNRRKNG